MNAEQILEQPWKNADYRWGNKCTSYSCSCIAQLTVQQVVVMGHAQTLWHSCCKPKNSLPNSVYGTEAFALLSQGLECFLLSFVWALWSIVCVSSIAILDIIGNNGPQLQNYCAFLHRTHTRIFALLVRKFHFVSMKLSLFPVNQCMPVTLASCNVHIRYVKLLSCLLAEHPWKY